MIGTYKYGGLGLGWNCGELSSDREWIPMEGSQQINEQNFTSWISARSIQVQIERIHNRIEFTIESNSQQAWEESSWEPNWVRICNQITMELIDPNQLNCC